MYLAYAAAALALTASVVIWLCLFELFVATR
jgi:hypothetical protein